MTSLHINCSPQIDSIAEPFSTCADQFTPENNTSTTANTFSEPIGTTSTKSASNAHGEHSLNSIIARRLRAAAQAGEGIRVSEGINSEIIHSSQGRNNRINSDISDPNTRPNNKPLDALLAPLTSILSCQPADTYSPESSPLSSPSRKAHPSHTISSIPGTKMTTPGTELGSHYQRGNRPSNHSLSDSWMRPSQCRSSHQPASYPSKTRRNWQHQRKYGNSASTLPRTSQAAPGSNSPDTSSQYKIEYASPSSIFKTRSVSPSNAALGVINESNINNDIATSASTPANDTTHATTKNIKSHVVSPSISPASTPKATAAKHSNSATNNGNNYSPQNPPQGNNAKKENKNVLSPPKPEKLEQRDPSGGSINSGGSWGASTVPSRQSPSRELSASIPRSRSYNNQTDYQIFQADQTLENGNSLAEPDLSFPKARKNARKSPRTRVITAPVDIDEISLGSSGEEEDDTGYYSAPTEADLRLHEQIHSLPLHLHNGGILSAGLMMGRDNHSVPNARTSRRRFPADCLLSQMGMEVHAEDYCIEGEFSSRVMAKEYHSLSPPSGNSPKNKMQTTSLTPSWPVSPEFNDKPSTKRNGGGFKEGMKKINSNTTGGVRSMTKLARLTIGSIINKPLHGDTIETNTNMHMNHQGKHQEHHSFHTNNTNNNNNQPSHHWNRQQLRKLLSLLRGGKQPKNSEKIPHQIITIIQPDDEDVAITPEDLLLIQKWQEARARKEYQAIYGPIPWDEGVSNAGNCGSSAIMSSVTPSSRPDSSEGREATAHEGCSSLQQQSSPPPLPMSSPQAMPKSSSPIKILPSQFGQSTKATDENGVKGARRNMHKPTFSSEDVFSITSNSTVAMDNRTRRK